MKRLLTIVMMSILATSTLTGCYGKFALTRKVYQANGEVPDKFLRSALTWAMIIIPVYGVAGLADFVIFNTIEFWSGKNPVALGEKDFQYAEGDKRFDVHAVKSGGTITYEIKQYENGRYVDSFNVDWDLKTGRSTMMHRDLVKASSDYRLAQVALFN